jgi:polysaccharide export outer membrane protein
MFVLGGAAGLASAAMIGSAAAAAVGGSQPEGYRLGTGDRVRVIVFGEDQLTGEFEVSGAGLISLPLIGNISAQGLTTVELQKVITTALSDGYLQDPRVSIEVLTYRPFYILGEVNKPGEYPYTDNLTVLNAVATANGFTYRAATRRVYIKHKNEPNEKLYPLTSSTIILPGDTIRIGERYF